MEINLKYIDPSYMIRSLPANPHDSAFCLVMGHSAVHAGMAGRTGMIVGYWNHQFTMCPSPWRSAGARRSIRAVGSGAASWPPPARRRRSSEQDMRKIRKERKEKTR